METQEGEEETILNGEELLHNVQRTEREYAFQQQMLHQAGGNLDPRRPGRFHFDLRPFQDRKSERMGVRERVYNATLRQTGSFIPSQNLAEALENGLRHALLELVRTIPDDDHVYFTVSSNRLNNNYRAWGMRARDWRRGDDRVDLILGHLGKMLNSNEQFEMNDSFNVSFTHVLTEPRGSGRPRKRKPGHQYPEVRKRMKQSEINIPRTDDGLCCARAIVTAKAWVDGHPQWRSFKRGFKIQLQAAIDLHGETQVPFGPCGYEELEAFSKAPSLYDYQLLVVDAERQFTVMSYGPPQPKQLVLLYEDNHNSVVKSLPAFFGTSYVCPHCYKGYNDQGTHQCRHNQDHCKGCQQTGCPDFIEARARHQAPTLSCQSCCRRFYGDTCLQNHLTQSQDGRPVGPNKASVCSHRRRCASCLRLLVGLKVQHTHRCGYITCPSCREYVDAATHKCFLQVCKSPAQERARQRRSRPRCGGAEGIQTLRANESEEEEENDEDDEKTQKPPVHVFFDIESMQVNGRHVANLVVAETDEDDRRLRFLGDQCVHDFLEWLDTLTENETRKVTVLAHNFQGYDGYFVVFQYHDDNQIVKQLRNGAKLLQVVRDDIQFIDSLSFFQFALRAFSKTFGLTELKKGHFPHLFNVPENQEYVGPLPAKHFYMPEAMSVKDRAEFDLWHDEQVAKGVQFDFQKELVEYCESDVQLVKQGCLQFKDMFEELTGFNPFDHVTIASACNRDLRQNRMEPNTIASEPLHGWRRLTNQSHVAREWLHWEDHCLRKTLNDTMTLEEREQHNLMDAAEPDYRNPLYTPRLQHVDNGVEYRIPHSHYTVDGYDAETNTVYEFQGCYWHGCPKCYPHWGGETHARLMDRTFGDVYELTQRKRRFLQSRGYTVREMWECDWRRLKAAREDVREYVATLDFVPPLDPREAFCGGRTNAIKLYHCVDETVGEQIQYYDYTSLYPFVNKMARYPVGHPQIISQPSTTNISDYFGLIKCHVLPPRHLYHPVLPYKHAEKLLFPLCRTCAEQETAKPILSRSWICAHDMDQRTLLGTWCTPELEKAIALGYVIRHVHEVWHFSQSKVGLFHDYVNTWLKIKTEASGWPKDVGDDEAKRRQFLRDFETREGIRLEYDKMVANPGLKQLAKMMLNSMWGKFGQRPNKTQVVELNDPRKFHDFLNSNKLDVQYVSLLTEQRVEVHYKYQDEDTSISPNLNIFVAAFTTCWARLRLYEALELLGERILYFDTDSVFFTHKPGESKPELGNFLGDFKDELGGAYITEFVSGGPKNYGYLTSTGKRECKVRGFALNTEGLAHLNYAVLRQNTLDELQRPLDEPRQTAVPITYKIHRNAESYTVHTRPMKKQYMLVYGKRVVNPHTFLTYPFGYGESDEADDDNVN